jgi:signal transduction histidine kinase
MNLTVILIGVIVVLLVLSSYALIKLHGTKKKAEQMLSVLEDIQHGNLKRRILATNNDLTDEICYKINEIIQRYEQQLIKVNLTEKTNKQIMTSLAHDVRTPLTTLIGYLDAIADGAVTGIEKEQYIKTAQTKAYALKNYTDDLFEWFKINSQERSYHFEMVDINELSRNVISDWITQFEMADLSYNIEIASDEIEVVLDVSAYQRILNNLIHNAVKHSSGSSVCIAVKGCSESIQVTISDNGKGISQKDLPYIFERLYKCDDSRPIGSSGLGLAIVHELVKVHNGSIVVASVPNVETKFSLNMKKTRVRQGFGKVVSV